MKMKLIDEVIEKVIDITEDNKKVVEVKDSIPFLIPYDSQYVLFNLKGINNHYKYVVREQRYNINERNEIVYEKVIEKVKKGPSRLETKVYAKDPTIPDSAYISSMDEITKDTIDNPNYAVIYSKSNNSDKTLCISDRIYHLDYGEVDRNDLLMSQSGKDKLAGYYLKERVEDFKQRKDYYIYYLTLYQGLWSNRAFEAAIDRIRLFVLPYLLRSHDLPTETMLSKEKQYTVLIPHMTVYFAITTDKKDVFISDLIKHLSLEYGLEGVVLQRRLVTKEEIRILKRTEKRDRFIIHTLQCE